jgi:(p)ppGpp synthase/HD superfamily hydrolase
MSAEYEPPFVAGRPLVRAALAWATRMHRGQSRAVDDAPFILHPVEVAALLSGRGCAEHVIAAGLLHDAIENTTARVEDIRERFGDRVADTVAAVTEDAAIEDYAARKAALRDRVARSGPDAHAVFAADKLAKTRELRAQAARTRRVLDDPALRRRLEHYELSLAMLQREASDLAFVHQLAFELWALRMLPPRGARPTPAVV